MRDHEIYVADCIDCHKPVESRALPVPDRCTRCQTALDDKLRPLVLSPWDPDQMETVSVDELHRMTSDNLRRLEKPVVVVDRRVTGQPYLAVLMSYTVYQTIQKEAIRVSKPL